MEEAQPVDPKQIENKLHNIPQTTSNISTVSTDNGEAKTEVEQINRPRMRKSSPNFKAPVKPNAITPKGKSSMSQTQNLKTKKSIDDLIKSQ